jgi:hypothetical protein
MHLRIQRPESEIPLRKVGHAFSLPVERSSTLEFLHFDEKFRGVETPMLVGQAVSPASRHARNIEEDYRIFSLTRLICS